MNFTMTELTQSTTAIKNKIDNTPLCLEHYNNLMRLVVDCLQPLRNFIQKPIIVCSGYRRSSVNALVGGVINSQHIIGQAVDIKVTGYSALELCHMIRNFNIPFDQLIVYKDRGFVHLSHKEKGDRKEIKYV